MYARVYKGKTYAEHRRFPRMKFKLWVHFKCLERGGSSLSLESLAEDLGAGGMAMRSDHQLKGGQLLMLTLFLPPEDKRVDGEEMLIYSEKECMPVDVLARVAWCEPRAEEFMLGLQFLDLDQANRTKLKAFLVDYNLDRPDSALYT